MAFAEIATAHRQMRFREEGRFATENCARADNGSLRQLDDRVQHAANVAVACEPEQASREFDSDIYRHLAAQQIILGIIC